MFAKYLYRSIELFHPFAWLLLGILFLTPWSVLADVHGLCSEADQLTLSSTFRNYKGNRSCYRIDVPSPGIVAIYVSAPGSPEAEPQLTFLANGPKNDPEALDHMLVHEAPRWVIFEAFDSGTFFVIAGPEDPTLPLTGYKLHAAFTSRISTKDVDEGDEEGCKIDAPGLRLPESPDFHLSVLKTGLFGRDSLYGVGESDDHSDTPLCATPIGPGRSVSGIFKDAKEDDEDVFTFVVEKLRVVRIELTAGHLTLYDGKGQRLASSSKGAEPLSLVRALSPGRYYLRLQKSFWNPGEDYVLSLQVLDEP